MLPPIQRQKDRFQRREDNWACIALYGYKSNNNMRLQFFGNDRSYLQDVVSYYKCKNIGSVVFGTEQTKWTTPATKNHGKTQKKPCASQGFSKKDACLTATRFKESFILLFRSAATKRKPQEYLRAPIAQSLSRDEFGLPVWRVRRR